MTPSSPTPLTILILGSSGNIGQAAVRLALAQGYRVLAGDYDQAKNKSILETAGLEEQIKAGHLQSVAIDASSLPGLVKQIKALAPSLCLSTLPAGEISCKAAVASALAGCHYLSSNFLTSSARRVLDDYSAEQSGKSFSRFLQENNLISCWEHGLDPGLDSWLFQKALAPFAGGEIISLKSTGAGVAEDPADTYFYTWAGITNGMGHRPATVIVAGKERAIGPTEKFASHNRHGFETITLSDDIVLETYANDGGGLALVKQAEAHGIRTDQIRLAATLTGRHQGHCALWDPLVRELNLLDDRAVYQGPLTMNHLLAHCLSQVNANDLGAPLQALHAAHNGAEIIDGDKVRGSHILAERLYHKNFFALEPLMSGPLPPTPKNLTENHLARIYARQEGKRDRSVIHIELEGISATGQGLRNLIELNAYGDYELSGLSSMQKTVAGTLVAAAKEMLGGKFAYGLQGAATNQASGLAILSALEAQGLLSFTEMEEVL